MLKQLDARLSGFAAHWNPGFKLARQGTRKFTPPTVEHDPDVTLEPLMNLWAKGKKPCKSALDDAKSVVRDLTDLFGNIPLVNFTRDDFDYFAAELRKLRR